MFIIGTVSLLFWKILLATYPTAVYFFLLLTKPKFHSRNNVSGHIEESTFAKAYHKLNNSIRPSQLLFWLVEYNHLCGDFWKIFLFLVKTHKREIEKIHPSSSFRHLWPWGNKPERRSQQDAFAWEEGLKNTWDFNKVELLETNLETLTSSLKYLYSMSHYYSCLLLFVIQCNLAQSFTSCILVVCLSK